MKLVPILGLQHAVITFAGSCKKTEEKERKPQYMRLAPSRPKFIVMSVENINKSKEKTYRTIGNQCINLFSI